MTTTIQSRHNKKNRVDSYLPSSRNRTPEDFTGSTYLEVLQIGDSSSCYIGVYVITALLFHPHIPIWRHPLTISSQTLIPQQTKDSN